jgi:hypothetical protein
MLLLTSTSDKIQVITGSAVVAMKVQAAFADYDPTQNPPSTNPGRTNTSISGAATTDVVAAPGANIIRNVKWLSIYNAHATSSNAITVQHTDGTTVSILTKYTLLPGETLYYVEAGYFAVLDIAGTRKTAPNTGGLLRRTVLTGNSSGAAPFTTSPYTNTIHVRLAGAGGSGGGSITAATSGSAGGGGASGGYAEKLFAVSPSTTYAYAIGQNVLGVSGANGVAGGNSTFTVGGVTVTAFGGPGGTTSTGSTLGANLGGASPAVSTNGDLNCGGDPGDPGIILSAAVVMSGAGGSWTRFGVGGSPRNTQAAGVGGGIASGGSGGALVSAGASNAGGSSFYGFIVVEEYA